MFTLMILPLLSTLPPVASPFLDFMSFWFLFRAICMSMHMELELEHGRLTSEDNESSLLQYPSKANSAPGKGKSL